VAWVIQYAAGINGIRYNDKQTYESPVVASKIRNWAHGLKTVLVAALNERQVRSVALSANAARVQQWAVHAGGAT
jgi:hypothetical protein